MTAINEDRLVEVVIACTPIRDPLNARGLIEMLRSAGVRIEMADPHDGGSNLSVIEAHNERTKAEIDAAHDGSTPEDRS